MRGAGGCRAWLIVYSCRRRRNRTFPAILEEPPSFVNAMWVGPGSRGRSARATCLSRARARLTKCSSNHRPGRNSIIFHCISPLSRSSRRSRHAILPPLHALLEPQRTCRKGGSGARQADDRHKRFPRAMDVRSKLHLARCAKDNRGRLPRSARGSRSTT